MDNDTLRSIRTDSAIEAFREVERKKYQLELKEHLLTRIFAGEPIDITRYYDETEKIRAKFERDREVAAIKGLLPREAS